MKSTTINLYTYDELSDSAKKKARDGLISGESFDSSEMEASLKAFEKVFPVRIRKWQCGGCAKYINFRFLLDEDHESLTGWRLATYIWNNYRDDIYTRKHYYGKTRMVNGKPKWIKRVSKIKLESQNCPLTGVCFDEDLLDPIWKFLKKPDSTTFIELMQDCLNSWINACESNWEYEQSEEYIKEMCDANEYTFLHNGTMWN